MRTTSLLAVAVLCLTPVAHAQEPSPGRGTTWNVDRNHTQVGFTVRHFFTPVRGKFETFDIALEFDPARPESSAVRVRIEVASVNTGNERRDNDLRSPNFFEVARFPAITFESSSVRPTGPDTYVAVGTLTIKDVSREVELPVRLLGRQEVPARDGGTREVAGFETSLTIDRRDFGVGTGDWVRTNVVGGEVRIEITVEARR